MIWCANLTLLYREYPFVERLARAAADGLEAVEFWWPRGEDLNRVAAAVPASGLRVALMNIDSGDMEAGERGFFNLRERRREVLEATRLAVELASEVGCTRLNAPVGLDGGFPREEQLACVVAGLREAVAITRPAGITLHVEALNDIDNPRYLLHSTAAARRIVSEVGPGVALQFDAYHMGRMGEDIVALAHELGTSEIGHVQIADHPGRHEPGTGRLPLRAFVRALESAGYSGCVGLEYLPLVDTPSSLARLRALDFLPPAAS